MSDALRISGAANNTSGSINIQDNNHETTQCLMKLFCAKNGKLAIAAATAEVSPD